MDFILKFRQSPLCMGAAPVATRGRKLRAAVASAAVLSLSLPVPPVVQCPPVTRHTLYDDNLKARLRSRP